MKLITWIVLSAENSSKLSSTVKNGLPALLAILAVFNINTEGLPQVADLLVDLAMQLSALVLTGRTLYFAFRKLKTTMLGTNAVLNDGSLR